MCIRDSREQFAIYPENFDLRPPGKVFMAEYAKYIAGKNKVCLLYTSDAADERSSVDLGGRRIIKKKKKRYNE